MSKKKLKARVGVSAVQSVAELDELLSAPEPDVIEAVRQLDGDLLILGVGGKMGPSLARLAMRAMKAAEVQHQVIGVSTFSKSGLRPQLEGMGLKTIKADVTDAAAVDALPDARNVIYMVGRKFGSTGDEATTWATNVLAAGLVGRRYKKSRIVAFSSGNVYPLESLADGGSTERTVPGPIGEYAMSCLGRERMFEHVANAQGAKVVQLRLNYAVELRYGVLVDVARQVWKGHQVDVTMSHVNVAWQGYANGVALQALALANKTPRILNVTGPETVSIHWLAERFAAIMDKKVKFTGEPSGKAYLSNAAECHKLFGYPSVSLDTLVDWTADWIMNGGELLGKSTHFQVSDGNY